MYVNGTQHLIIFVDAAACSRGHICMREITKLKSQSFGRRALPPDYRASRMFFYQLPPSLFLPHSFFFTSSTWIIYFYKFLLDTLEQSKVPLDPSRNINPMFIPSPHRDRFPNTSARYRTCARAHGRAARQSWRSGKTMLGAHAGEWPKAASTGVELQVQRSTA